MKIISSGLMALILLFVAACATNRAQIVPEGLKITEVHPSKKTALVTQNLLHLNQVYDLEPLLLTREIKVQDKALATATPVLTLDTRFAEEPNKLLSLWLHQLMELWLKAHPTEVEAAVGQLNKIYTRIPPPDTHRTMLACYLEYQALIFYLGEAQARSVILSFIQKKQRHHWVFGQLLKKDPAIKKIVETGNLLPPLQR